MKNKSSMIKYLLVVILVLSIFLGIYSAYLFGTGFHNVDLARNLKIINTATAPYGLVFVDVGSQTIKWTSDEMYKEGQGQMRQSFALLGLSALLIGGSLIGVIRFNGS